MNNLRSGIILWTSGGPTAALQHAFEGGIATHVAAVWHNIKTKRYEVIEQGIKPSSTLAEVWVVLHAHHICGVGDLLLDLDQRELWDYEAGRKLQAQAWYDVGLWLGFAFRPLARVLGKRSADICTELVMALCKRAGVDRRAFPGLDYWRYSPADLIRYLGITIKPQSVKWLTDEHTEPVSMLEHYGGLDK